MIMADVLVWFFAMVAVYLVLVCEWLAAVALAPESVEACRREYARPARATLVGLVTSAPLVLVGAAVAGGSVHPLPKALASGFLLLLFLPAFVGSAGLAARLGRGLGPKGDDRLVPWVLRGGIVLVPTLLVPLLGWFLLLPWTLVSGFGAALLAWRSRRLSAPATVVP